MSWDLLLSLCSTFPGPYGAIAATPINLAGWLGRERESWSLVAFKLLGASVNLPNLHQCNSLAKSKPCHQFIDVRVLLQSPKVHLSQPFLLVLLSSLNIITSAQPKLSTFHHKCYLHSVLLPRVTTRYLFPFCHSLYCQAAASSVILNLSPSTVLTSSAVTTLIIALLIAHERSQEQIASYRVHPPLTRDYAVDKSKPRH